MTRDDIIREALINTGKIGGTQYIAPQHTTDCARKLNMLVKQWMGKQDFAPGLKMWTRDNADLFLSASKYAYNLGPTGDNWAAGITVAQPNNANFNQSQLNIAAAANATSLNVGTAEIVNFTVGDYIVVELNSGDIFSSTVLTVNTGTGVLTIPATGLSSAAAAGSYVWNYSVKGTRPLEFVSAVLRDINNNDTPLDYMTIQTYSMLPSKTSPTYLSDPTAIYYEADINPITVGSTTAQNGTLYIDCGGAQDVTKHINATFLRPVQDFNNPADNPDFPAEWFLALAWGLTKQIAPMFNAAFTKDMQDNYDEALAIARSTNPETTELYFQPNADRP